MNKIAAALLASCLAVGTSAYAQDAMTKADTKKAMSQDDCKSHVNTATGQKAADPANADTDAKCATMASHKASKMKKHAMKKNDMAPADGAASGSMN